MFPLLPPYMVKELVNEYVRKDNTVSRRSTAHDPDGFFADDALQPDPVFMGLRAIVQTGPIGALMRWLDSRIEAHEDRIHGSQPDANVTSSRVTSCANTVVDRDADDQSERKIAA